MAFDPEHMALLHDFIEARQRAFNTLAANGSYEYRELIVALGCENYGAVTPEKTRLLHSFGGPNGWALYKAWLARREEDK